MGAAIAPEAVLRDLAELWTSLTKPGEESSVAGVLRACSMTLVVAAEEDDDAAALGETIAALMPEHPARAIVIRLRGPGAPLLTARVFAQCWMPFGERRQICCEQIEIAASDASLADLPSAVLPLAVPDLPVILWCRSARLAARDEFRLIVPLATKVVLDTFGIPDPRPAIGRLAAMARDGILVSDLAWTRLTGWRQMLSRLFENRSYLALLPQISRVRVTYGGEIPPSSVPYMGWWVANSLADGGVNAEFLPERDPAGPEGRLVGIELTGGGVRMELKRDEDRMIVTVNGLSNCMNLPQPNDYLVMREELGIVRRDPVFERTLASAARFAVSSSDG